MFLKIYENITGEKLVKVAELTLGASGQGLGTGIRAGGTAILA